ncbi:MAG TPA: ROK family protein [Clostridia bacterium]|nr:ROK family protein [Clostridia bacterium]
MHIGIDIGGTNIACGIIDESGQLVFKKRMPSGGSREAIAILDDIAYLINELKIKAAGKINSIGIGVPGIVAKDKGYIYYCPNINLGRINMKEEIEKRTGLLTFVDNDGNLAALAEREVGVLKGVKNAVLLTLGTGIGAGIIVSGEMLRGANGLSSEVGHMVIGKNYYDCNCGKNGCFETFASGSALIGYTEKLLDESNKSSLLRNSKRINAKAIIDAAKKGDKLANESYSRFINYLGVGIVNLINILDPDIIAIGGGLANAGEFLTVPLKEKVESLLLVNDFPHAEIKIAKLGDDAGIIGAALLAKKMYKA